ncbi:MAG TPA: response regulator [Planctomycetaceae bacterium]|nr:response regulator [Planctomycetaceae bacterium]
MKNVTRLALVDPNDANRAALKTLLLGIDTVWLDADCSRYEFFTDVVRQSQPELALIALDSNPQKGLELIARVRTEVPNCQILVLSSSQEGSLILQAIRSGAREFLSQPLKLEDFLAALDRVRQTATTRTGEASPSRNCQVYSVLGASGGVGCTSLAINLGCCLAQVPGRSVAIIDLDLALGDADVWLDIIPDYTIQDVADNISRLDYSLLKRSLTKHDCGAFLLPRPVELGPTPPLTPDEFRRIVSLLKATFTHLVIDLSKSFTPLDLAAMDISDSVLMVTQLDLPCLRNAVRITHFMQREGNLKEKLKVIVNRLGLEDSQISMNKALETLGCQVFASIPNDYSTMVEARNNGAPLLMQAPRAKVTKSLQQLATLLDNGTNETEEKSDDKKARRGLFSFLGTAK